MEGDEVTEALPPDLPDLPDGWEWKPLGDYVSSGRGISYGIVQPGDHQPDGIPILRAENVQNSRVELRDVMRVSPSIESKHKRTRLSGGEVLITLVGAYFGKVAVAPKSAAGYNTARAVGVVPVQSDELFLSHALQSPVCQRYIQTWATTTAQPTLNLGDVGRIPIPSPPSKIRDAIAAVLGALDDKIELNRRMNATLEAMARALFQSWFVDFDPVHAKLHGRPPAALDPATAALFPGSFQDSPVGHIPKGWELKALGETIELAYGKPLKAEDRKNGPICVYGANGPVGWHDEKLISGPGIVVGRKGNPGVVTWAHNDFYPIDTTFYVEPKGECRSLYFLFYALSNHDLANLSADSAVPGLNRNHAYMSKQVIPTAPLLEAFDKQAAPIFAAIQANETQSRTLATLRDMLLPKLLTGEICL